MQETLRVFTVVFLLLCIGIFALAWPKKVQQPHLKLLSRKNSYSGWVEGDIYISLLRFIGLCCLAMSVSMIIFRLVFPWIPPANK
jgi:hypothetical protein